MNALLKNEMVESKIIGNRYYFCFRPHEKTNIIRIYRYTIIILCHWGMILGMLGKGMVIYMQNVNEVDLTVKPEEAVSFLYFAKLVINRRVIDHIRKSKNSMESYLKKLQVVPRSTWIQNYFASI